MSAPLKPYKTEAKRFLDLLHPGGAFTFQTFDDDQDRKRSDLVQVLHGTLEQHFEILKQYNERGAGVFVCINETNLKGRKKTDVLKVRSCFVDLDGSPVEPVIRHPLEPAILVESSAGRWHAYYPCQDMPLEEFTSMQHAIADTFNGDRACCDLPRVMRLPGFWHQKVKTGLRSEPFMTRIESGYGNLSYTRSQLIEAFATSVDHISDQVSDDLNIDESLQKEEIRRALVYIDPEPRVNWIKVGHSLKSVHPNLLAVYLEWSRGALTGRKPKNFVSDEDVITAWNSYSPVRIGGGAIFSMAKANGYVSTARQTRLRLGTQVEVAALICSEINEETSAPLVYTEGTFWCYRSTYWEEMLESELRKRIHRLDGVSYGDKRCFRVSSGFIDGTIKEMAAISDSSNFFEASEQGVNLRNGFVKISATGKITLEPHSPGHRQRFFIDQDWLPAIGEVADGFLQRLLFGSFGHDDVESHRLIFEIVGAAITSINTGLSNPKAFVFHGPSAANGKSTIQALIRNLLPRHVVACVAPAELGEPQFLATLAGRQVNLTDEISSSKAIATDRFKATVTGDPVQAKAIYREPFTFTPRALHVFSANHLPSFSGGVDSGIVRRIIVVPFNRSIPESERIPELAAKIIEHEGDMLVSLALQAAADVVARGGYTISKKCEAATTQWFKDVDPVAEWFEEGGLERHVNTAGILVRELYIRFRQDMDNLGIQYIPGQNRFTQRLREMVAADMKWEILRRSKGETVVERTLVTNVMSFSTNP